MSEWKQQLLANIALLPARTISIIARKLGQSEKLVHRTTSHRQLPQQKRKAFASYQPTAHDVFVCTYSKSGTNWTMQIAHQIAHYGEAEFDNIYDLIPWPEARMPGNLAKLDTRQQTPTGLRVIKTHLESEYVPYNSDTKYIVVIRDPKDVFVSSYYFGKGILRMMGVEYDTQSWLEQFTSKHFFFDSWPAHTASYWTWRKRPNVLLLTFDKMKQNLRGICQQIADLMQVSLTTAQLDLVVEKSSFGYMKRIERKFMPRFLTVGQNPVMMRRGKSGVSGELLNKEQQQYLDAFCQAELKRLGSDFPYEELFM